MPIVTLLEKTYGHRSPKTFEPTFASLFKGLKAKLKVVGRADRGWLQVDVSGEDGAVALRLLDEEIGLAPVSADKLKKFSVIRGRVISSKKSTDKLYVDVGVFSPQTRDATVSLQKLQAQLVDGKKLPLWKLIKLYCLYNNLPLKIRLIGDMDTKEGTVEAELSETQLSQLSHWIGSSLDRLIVLGSCYSTVEHAIRISKHARDIVKIEPLGVLEHAVLCKLGTDAVGLIPKLGRLLPMATLAPFSSRKILKLVNRVPL